MDVVLSKTLVFISFMVIGGLLKFKFNRKEEKDGLKKIILNLALPATIFIALLQVRIDMAFLLLPLMALAFNISLFALTPWFLDRTGVGRNSPVGRTAWMLLPSLAPGLSCFPFILEFLGPEYLARAAMADLGNKFFVLLVLYLVAVRWFRKNCEGLSPDKSRRGTIVALLKKMFSEPVNLLIFAAMILVVFGIGLADFPVFLREIIERLSYIMTPLVLLYIGLALKLKKHQAGLIFSLLTFRAGVSLLLAGGAILFTGIEADQNILLVLSFVLSACSFWPFMHIAMVDAEEKDLGIPGRTFDPQFAIAVLAFSLPVSVVFILLVLSSGSLFATPGTIFISGFMLTGLGFVPLLLRYGRNFLERRMALTIPLALKNLVREGEAR